MLQLLSEQLTKFLSILDSVFTGVANTSSAPIGWEGGELVGS